MKQFIALSDVKINGDYTYLRDVAPSVTEKEPMYINGDTWLDLVTGYSYILTDQTVGTWERYQEALDTKIELRRDEVFKNVIKYLNNIFPIDRNKIYLDANEYVADFAEGLPDGWTRHEAWTIFTYESMFSNWQFEAVDSDTFCITALTTLYGNLEDSFKVDDTIYISGSRRNDGYFTIASIDLDNNKIYVDEELESGIANAFIYLCNVPSSVIQIAADMVWYDLTVRSKMKGLKSEKVGTYSWTAQDSINGIDYPSNVTAGLEQYKSIAVGGQSVYVD